MTHLNTPSGNTQPIHIVYSTDSICAPCPHRRLEVCDAQEKIAALDQAHAKALALHETKTMTWQEAKERIAGRITLPTFRNICASCEWQSSGICESMLQSFLEKKTIA